MTETKDSNPPYRRGVLDRPRTVIVGHWTEEELSRIDPLVGMRWHFEGFYDLRETVAEAEIDLLIMKDVHNEQGSSGSLRNAPFTIYLPGSGRGVPPSLSGEYLYSKECAHYEYEVTDSPGPIPDLARRAAGSIQSAVGMPRWYFLQGRFGNVEQALKSDSWLLRTDEGICAFHHEDFLLVPAQMRTRVSDAEWIAAAIHDWKPRAPKTFPRAPDWRDDPLWKTESELAALAKITQVEAERRAYNEKQDLVLAELMKVSQEESAKVDKNERRLLTSAGDNLVAAVRSALETLGYDIEAPPEEATPAKAEDLIATRGEWPEWSASIEVKGFSRRGPRVPEVIKLDKRRQRRGTHAAVLFVNCQTAHPPGSRDYPFAGNQESLESVEEAGVCVVDTRHLFRALSDEHLAASLIQAMSASHGVYAPPPE